MSVITGSSNNVYAIDKDTGHVVWQRHFDAPLPAATAACPGGITAAATRIVSVVPPAPPPAGRAGGGGARGGGYRGSVGQPGEGVPIDTRRSGGGRNAAAAPWSRRWRRERGRGPRRRRDAAPDAAGADAGRGAARGAARRAVRLAADSRGGRGGQNAANAGIPGAPNGGGPGGGIRTPVGRGLRRVERRHAARARVCRRARTCSKPAAFLPANARFSDPIAVDTTLYAATTGNCAGAPNGVWAIDLNSDQTSPSRPGRPTAAASSAPSRSRRTARCSSRLASGQASAGGYANAIVALDPKTLQPKDWYTAPSADFVTGPLVFKHGDTGHRRRGDERRPRAAARCGRARRRESLHAALRVQAAHERQRRCCRRRALAAWQDTIPVPASLANTAVGSVQAGTTWILVPVSGRPSAAAGATAAHDCRRGCDRRWRARGAEGGRRGRDVIARAWLGIDAICPRRRRPSSTMASCSRSPAAKSAAAGAAAAPAVLYAFNGATGKRLWTSAQDDYDAGQRPKLLELPTARCTSARSTGRSMRSASRWSAAEPRVRSRRCDLSRLRFS